MSLLYLNPFSLDTLKDKWNQECVPRLKRVKEVLTAFKFDLLVRNPYNLIVGNTRNVVLNNSASKVERVFAGVVVVLSCMYTVAIYGFLVFSFGESIALLSTLSQSEKIGCVACVVKEIGSQMIFNSYAPIKYLVGIFSNISTKTSSLYLNALVSKVCNLMKIVFDRLLLPLYFFVKKVLFWNYLQLILLVRKVFDKAYELFLCISQKMSLFFREHMLTLTSA